MSTKFEGILIHKTPYKHRDLIGKVLLRSGEVMTFLFYGGQGGGSKKKSSTLELGHMLKIETSIKKYSSNIESAKEWKLTWFHNKLRENHHSFYLMCFYLEFIQKVAPEYTGEGGTTSQGLFRVLSNAIFYLEDRVAKKEFYKGFEFTLFVSKLVIELGVFPILDNCGLCGEKFNKELPPRSIGLDEGFLCGPCSSTSELSVLNENLHPFLMFLQSIWNQKYPEIETNRDIKIEYGVGLLDFVAKQYQIDKGSFKTLLFCVN